MACVGFPIRAHHSKVFTRSSSVGAHHLALIILSSLSPVSRECQSSPRTHPVQPQGAAVHVQMHEVNVSSPHPESAFACAQVRMTTQGWHLTAWLRKPAATPHVGSILHVLCRATPVAVACMRSANRVDSNVRFCACPMCPMCKTCKFDVDAHVICSPRYLHSLHGPSCQHAQLSACPAVSLPSCQLAQLSACQDNPVNSVRSEAPMSPHVMMMGKVCTSDANQWCVVGFQLSKTVL
jgi:hypothetical protein